MCARLDGVDPASDDPCERLKFHVYMQRLNTEALKTQALIMPHVAPDKAGAAAKAYLDAVLPVSPESVMREQFRLDQKGKAVERMKAFKASGVRIAGFGSAAWAAAEDRLGGPLTPAGVTDAPRGSFAPRRP